MERKTKIKFTDFECNLLINGMNEFRNMLLSKNLPTDDTCDHICHSSNALMKVLWKIISLFYRLFNIQQYCDCGVIHYDASVFG